MRAILGVLLGAMLVALWPAAAGAAPATVTFQGGKDNSRAYTPANSSATAEGDAHRVEAKIAYNGNYYSIVIAAPPGEELRPGVYEDVTPVGNNRPGRAELEAINFCASGEGPDIGAGRFEIKDIAYGTDGQVQRLWLLWEQLCDGNVWGTFGEVRMGDQAAAGAPRVAPWILRFGEGDVGRPFAPQPVTLVVPVGGLRLRGASIEGDGDYTLAGDSCTGAQLAAGASCQYQVRFVPQRGGVRSATLVLTASDGRMARVPLEGWSHGGSTRLTMHSEPGDWVGQGRDYAYGSGDGLTGHGRSDELDVDVVGPNNDWWGVIFRPGRLRGSLTPGHYQASGSGVSDQPSVYVFGQSRSCSSNSGEFDIRAVDYGRRGWARSFAADFVQRCDGSSAALRGTVEWRLGDTVAPAPWMVSGTHPPEQQPAQSPTAGGGPGASGAPPEGAAPSAGEPGGGRCRRRVYPSGLTVRGSVRSDRIRGSRAAQMIAAGAGNDLVRAGAGDDCVDAGSGRDRVSGGAGADILIGRSGNDVLEGGPGRDLLLCGAGRDVAKLGRGDAARGCERRVRVR